MTEYKLQYFPARGRAEVMRLLFVEAGIPFEDIRFTQEQWKDEKPNTPFGQLPVLYVDGSPLAQSGAIIRFLAREFKLNGTNSLQSAYIDMLLETLSDMFAKIPYFVADPEEKKKKMKEAFDNHVCPTLKRIESKLKELGGDYMIGKQFSAIDIVLANSTWELSNFKEGIMSCYPCLLALQKRVLERPNIKKWIKDRPVTDF